MSLLAPLLIGGASLLAVYLFAPRPRPPPRPSTPASSDPLPSLLVPAYTTHARHLPSPSKHAFSYPLLYLAVDLASLETRALDLPLRLFSYGGSPWSTVLGIRSKGYLTEGEGKSLREKLEGLLEGYGIGRTERVWLVTMPSFCGVEGINPLSVWYVYGEDKGLSAVVLEVHNTFGEKHAYVLKTDSPHREDTPAAGYDYAWTFPRAFHVSPFNSRSGYYRLDLVDPFPASSSTSFPPPDPEIKVFLRLLTPSRQTKLQALLASSPARAPIPFTRPNAWRIAKTLFLSYPFTLLSTTPRILYQAYHLHYSRRLLVYPRPEPARPGAEAEANPPELDHASSGAAIGYQPASPLETTARRLVLEWLEVRAEQLRIEVELVFRDPSRKGYHFDSGESEGRYLKIETADPKFFANLLGSVSARHYLVMAPELLTRISDPALFERVFAGGEEEEEEEDGQGDGDGGKEGKDGWLDWAASRVRERHLRFFWTHSHITPPPDLVTYRPAPHYLVPSSTADRLRVLLVLLGMYAADVLEEWVMYAVGARFVDGQAPWELWERALGRLYAAAKDAPRDSEEREGGADTGAGIGGSEDGWEEVKSDEVDGVDLDLGSVLY